MPAFFLLSAYEVSNLYDNSGFAKEKQISYPGISWGGVLVGGSVPELLTQRLRKSERSLEALAPIMAG